MKNINKYRRMRRTDLRFLSGVVCQTNSPINPNLNSKLGFIVGFQTPRRARFPVSSVGEGLAPPVFFQNCMAFSIDTIASFMAEGVSHPRMAGGASPSPTVTHQPTAKSQFIVRLDTFCEKYNIFPCGCQQNPFLFPKKIFEKVLTIGKK